LQKGKTIYLAIVLIFASTIWVLYYENLIGLQLFSPLAFAILMVAVFGLLLVEILEKRTKKTGA